MRLISYFMLSLIFAAYNFCSSEPTKQPNENPSNLASGEEAIKNHSNLRARSGGPSGKLIKPLGGSVYNNHVGNVGNVEVIYRGVSDGSNSFGARTCTIDLHLVAKKNNTQINPATAFNISSNSAMNLAYGMRPHDSGSNQPIWVNFVPPVGACGDYYLVVYERQLYENTVIHFQSAAPLITFKCATTSSPKVFPVGSTVEAL